MTNNPTIYGVSRDLLEGLLTIAALSASAPYRELRALLDAPAVERQEPVTMKRQYLSVPGLWIECADDDPRAMTFYKQAPEVAALQTTIARLEARIAELESGRGEPVAWMYKREGGEVLGQLVQMESDDLKCIRLGKCYDDGTRYIWPREDYIEWKPLYAAPPAPVAVKHQERVEFEKWIVGEWPTAPIRYVRDALPENDPLHGTYCDEYLQRAWVGWQARACLDATAALNRPENDPQSN